MLSQSEAKAAGALEVGAKCAFELPQLLTAPMLSSFWLGLWAPSKAVPAQVKLEHLLLGLCQADKRLLSSSKLDLEKGRRMLRAQRTGSHAVRALAGAQGDQESQGSARSRPSCHLGLRAHEAAPHGPCSPCAVRRRRMRRSARLPRRCWRARRPSRGSWG